MNVCLSGNRRGKLRCKCRILPQIPDAALATTPSLKSSQAAEWASFTRRRMLVLDDPSR